MVILPFKDAPNYRYLFELDGRTYDIHLRYNVRADRWTFGMGLEDGTAIVAGKVIHPAVDLLNRVANQSYAPKGKLIAIVEDIYKPIVMDSFTNQEAFLAFIPTGG